MIVTMDERVRVHMARRAGFNHPLTTTACYDVDWGRATVKIRGRDVRGRVDSVAVDALIHGMVLFLRRRK